MMFAKTEHKNKRLIMRVIAYKYRNQIESNTEGGIKAEID